MPAQQQVIPGVEQFEKPDDSMTAIVKRCILDPTFDADKLKVLLDVQMQWEANEARKKFEAAFELFKKNIPVILKTKQVQAGQLKYSHAELDKITPILSDALMAVGIVHHWRPSDVNNRTTVTCIFKGFGHTEEMATLSGPPDTSGGKNSIQAIGSTNYYLQRYTLLAACGIAPKGCDNDGATGEGLPADTIEDYCIAISDAADIKEAKKQFNEGWEKAKVAKDMSAGERFIKVWNQKKKDLAEHKQ